MFQHVIVYIISCAHALHIWFSSCRTYGLYDPLCPTLLLNLQRVDLFRHLDGYVNSLTPKTFLLVLQLDANLGLSSAPFDDEIAHYLNVCNISNCGWVTEHQPMTFSRATAASGFTSSQAWWDIRKTKKWRLYG